jgi:signal peptidase
MRVPRRISQVLEVAVLLAIGALLLGQLLGQPILLGFVETGSMAPALEPNDGYIAIPAPLTGSIEPGDVIVFEAQELHGGGLVTHRVAAETERGYITKGDANPFLDQDGDEPPVTREQIVAEALQINGEVVVIPSLGMAITLTQAAISTTQTQLGVLLGTSLFFGTQGFLNMIFIVCLIAYVLLVLRESDTKVRSRERSRDEGLSTHHVIVALTLVLVVSITAAMILPAETHQLTVESNPGSTPMGSGLQSGEATTATVAVPNSGIIPVLVVFESQTDGIEATPSELLVDSREYADTEVTVTAPLEEGRVTRILVEHRYLALLPTPTIRALYGVHPWLPIVVIDAMIGIPFYLLGVALVGTGRVRRRSRDGSSSFGRLKRWFGRN